MIIYNRKSYPLEPSVAKLNYKGETLNVDNFDYSGTHLGERKITVVFESPKPIDFQIGDYLEYDTTYDNEIFTLQTAPIVTRVHNSLMLSYTLTFWWVGYELQLVKFLDVVTGEDDQFYYSSNAEVVLNEDVAGVARRIKYNMNRAGFTGTQEWYVIVDPSVGLERKDIVAENLSCWDVVALIKSEFGIEYKIKSSIRTIIIGELPEVVQGEDGDYVFEYGKDKGLCEINRLQNEQKVVTRVYGYGATRNIPANYRTGDNHSYHPRLMLPAASAPNGYIQDDALVAEYNVREDIFIDDSIYPTIGDPAIVAFDPIVDRPLNDTPQQVKVLVKDAYTSWAYDPATYPGIDPIKIYTLHPAEYRMENVPATDYSKFVVYIPDLGFDLNDENIKSTTDAVMVFNTGHLVGIEFKVVSFEKKMAIVAGVPTWVDSQYKVTLEKTSNAANYTLPNATVVPAIGDTFVFLNINTPDTYLPAAEARLLVATQAYFDAHKRSPEGYSIKVPEEFVARNPAIEAGLRESNAVKFRDMLMGVGVPDAVTVLIQSITISYKADKLLPTYELTISDSPIKGYLQKIEANLKSANQQISVQKVSSAITEINNTKSASILNQTIFNNLGQVKGDIIAPDSIQPYSLSTELRQTRYVLQAYFQVNHLGDANVAYGSTGVMVHKDIDVVWGELYDLDHQTWTITVPATFTVDPAKYYYVYIKGDVETGEATWVLSETKIGFSDIDGFYMFDWGVILPVRDGIRYSQNEHGINGVSSYVYVAYGTSLLGAGFTLTNDPALEYMAILTSPSEIETPVVGNFTGLWFKRKGDAVTSWAGLPDYQEFEFQNVVAGAQSWDLHIKPTFGYTIESISLETDTGTITGVSVKINATTITGLSGITVDTGVDTTSSTALKTVVAGDRITLSKTGETGVPTLIKGQINYIRT